jgi:hypothetical protein
MSMPPRGRICEDGHNNKKDTTMHRMIRWLTPVVALSMVLAFNRSTVRADDTKKADTGTVAGTVTGADGKPAADINVRIVKPMDHKSAPAAEGDNKDAKPQAAGDEKPAKGKGMRQEAVAKGKTDNDGKFSIADVPVGDYQVVAMDRATHTSGHEKVTVKAGETANVTITMKAGGPGKAKAGDDNSAK